MPIHVSKEMLAQLDQLFCSFTPSPTYKLIVHVYFDNPAIDTSKRFNPNDNRDIQTFKLDNLSIQDCENLKIVLGVWGIPYQQVLEKK